MKKRSNTIAVIAVAALLLIVLLMDVWTMFGQIRQLTKAAGISQLENINRELERSISDAESLTMETAAKARELLGDRDALEKFVYEEKEKIVVVALVDTLDYLVYRYRCYRRCCCLHSLQYRMEWSYLLEFLHI